ncbi:NUDIX hydrolase [bacterium]|nr:NUDIX hydrolase [bacterium]
MLDEKTFRIIKCAGGIVKNKDRIILIQIKQTGGWAFPKGKIGASETPLEAAKREIYEETGVKKISLSKNLGKYSRPVADGKPVMLVIDMFLFETVEEKVEKIKNDVKDAKWIPISEIQKILSLKEDREFYISIKNILKGSSE